MRPSGKGAKQNQDQYDDENGRQHVTPLMIDPEWQERATARSLAMKLDLAKQKQDEKDHEDQSNHA